MLLLFMCSNTTEGTPLASAASVGQDDIVFYLLSIGACPNGNTNGCALKVCAYVHNYICIV